MIGCGFIYAYTYFYYHIIVNRSAYNGLEYARYEDFRCAEMIEATTGNLEECLRRNFILKDDQGRYRITNIGVDYMHALENQHTASQ